MYSAGRLDMARSPPKSKARAIRDFDGMKGRNVPDESVAVRACSLPHSHVPEAEPDRRSTEETGLKVPNSGRGAWRAVCLCRPRHDRYLPAGLPVRLARPPTIAGLRGHR